MNHTVIMLATYSTVYYLLTLVDLFRFQTRQCEFKYENHLFAVCYVGDKSMKIHVCCFA